MLFLYTPHSLAHYRIKVNISPLITQTLYYSKNVESFGNGLKRIADACNAAGCKFKFEVLKSGFVVVFYRAEDEDNLGGTPQVTPQVTPQDKIRAFCSEPRNKSEIAAHCGYKDIKHFTKQYLKPMLEAGQLAMTIPEKPNSKNQKYVTVTPNTKETQ